MNRLLGDVARRWVFETISVSPLEASCNRLQNILQRPDVASYVTKLYLVTFDPDEVINCDNCQDMEGEAHCVTGRRI